MFQIITDASYLVIGILAQVLIGCILGILLYAPLRRLFDKGLEKRNRRDKILHALIASISGVLLPLGSYGIIPVVLSASAAGVGVRLIVSFYISNSLFNTLVPYFENTFTWGLGIKRAIIALLAGVLSSYVIGAIKLTGSRLLRLEIPENLLGQENGIKRFAFTGNRILLSIGAYVIIGAVAESFFYAYALGDIRTWFYSASAGLEFARFLTKYDVGNHIFLIAIYVFNSLMSPLKLSSLLALWNIRGVILYYLFSFFICGALTISLFL
ncbi:MAG: permease [Clostridia bacterium]|nr:permease [Clostridia bacterium]